MTTYGLVYRLSSPAGWKGRRCRIVTLSPQHRNWLGKGEINTGAALVGIQFETGELACVPRQSVVPANSRPGWAALRNAGLTEEQLRERAREYQKRYQAEYRKLPKTG